MRLFATYGMVLAGVAFAALAWAGLDPWLHERLSSVTLFAAVLFATGAGTAVVCGVLHGVPRRDEAAGESSGHVPPRSGRRALQILLAEDTLANQRLVRRILNRRGHAVEVAANGREAVALLRHRDFDLALMDVQMPIMDGFQATAAIRAMSEPAKSGLPIVAITAQAKPEDRDRCLRCGMDAFVAKPVNARRLVAVVERLAGRSSLAAACPPVAESLPPRRFDGAAGKQTAGFYNGWIP